MEQEVPLKSVALVVGVTGMAGLSLAEALKKPKALGGPWKVYGTARRSIPSWFSSSIIDGYIAFDATNYEDTKKKLSFLSKEVTHIFWMAIKVCENEEANINVNTNMLENVLSVFKSSPTSTLRHVTLQTGTQYYMGSTMDVLLGFQLKPHETPFREDLPRLPYRNFYYPLEDIVSSYSASVTSSIHRPSIIVGASSRSFYNVLLSLCVYATICKYEGIQFKYPGTKYTWEHFCDMTDARVLAEQHIWAAVTDKAKNQAFNCTNGDVFAWKSLWKVLCEILDVEFVAFDENEKFDFIQEMKKKDKVWDSIVEQYGLYKTKLEEITSFASLHTALHFGFQNVSSMNKSREFGFHGCVDTMKSIKFWVEKLRQMKLIPK